MTGITKMHGDAIKITQLHYARAAADLGSFSRAAASLGVTQPALSHGIAALERALGGALFERSTTGVVPSALGIRVLPHLHTVLGALETLVAEAKASVGMAAEPLRMGVSPLIHPALIARAFQAARQHPPAALILKEDNLIDLRAALIGRRLDLILVPAVTGADGCSRRQIDSEPVHYLPSASQCPPDNHPVELADLSGQPLVMVGEACGLSTFTRALFARAGSQLNAYPGEAENYRSLEAWAGLGLGGALLPQSKLDTAGQARPINDHGQPVRIAYEALWFARSARASAIETLLDTLLTPT